MRPFLQISARKACRCFVGNFSVGQWINAQTFAENRNIKDNLTEMLISAVYFPKPASVTCVFGFTVIQTVMRKFGLQK